MSSLPLSGHSLFKYRRENAHFKQLVGALSGGLFKDEGLNAFE